jgi:predicted DNA-binding transcriptional regulator AlpA
MQLLTVRDVLKKLKISKSFLYKLMRNDESFPRPAKFSTRNTMFISEEIEQWISKKFKEYKQIDLFEHHKLMEGI